MSGDAILLAAALDAGSCGRFAAQLHRLSRLTFSAWSAAVDVVAAAAAALLLRLMLLGLVLLVPLAGVMLPMRLIMPGGSSSAFAPLQRPQSKPRPELRLPAIRT